MFKTKLGAKLICYASSLTVNIVYNFYMQNNSVKTDFDIAIVGGHLVGSLLACALADSGFQVALIDRQDAKYVKTIDSNSQAEHFDLRVFAINVASQRILQNLGLWESIEADRVFPYYAMHVWDAAGFGKINFDCSDIAATVLGHIIEDRVLCQAVRQQISSLSNVSSINGANLKAMNSSVHQVNLQLSNGRHLSAKLLVGADGIHSSVRQFANITAVSGSYSQTAIVATVRVEKSHQYTAWQRFLPTGPLAFLPLSENLCSIVWSLDDEMSQDYLSLSDSEFEQILTSAFEAKLGQVSLHSERRSFPLNYLYSKRYCLPRIVLVGDAAHAIHPLAGQGLNLGLLDIAVLADELKQAAKSVIDPGRLTILRRYERKRKGDNLLMLAAVSGFKSLFAIEHQSLAFARSMGINYFDKTLWLKQHIALQAAGLNGELPELALPI